MKIELAGGVIVNHDKELLVIHRNTLELTQTELIGGEVEPGETPEQALVREAAEEANARIRIIRFLCRQSFVHNGTNYNQHVFLATAPVRRYLPQESKFDDVSWLTLPNLRARTDKSLGLSLVLKKIVDGEISLSI